MVLAVDTFDARLDFLTGSLIAVGASGAFSFVVFGTLCVVGHFGVRLRIGDMRVVEGLDADFGLRAVLPVDMFAGRVVVFFGLEASCFGGSASLVFSSVLVGVVFFCEDRASFALAVILPRDAVAFDFEGVVGVLDTLAGVCGLESFSVFVGGDVSKAEPFKILPRLARLFSSSASGPFAAVQILSSPIPCPIPLDVDFCASPIFVLSDNVTLLTTASLTSD